MIRPIRSLLLAASLGLALPASVIPAAAQTPDRAAIEGIIRDYLLKNPEVIQEALLELERRQQENQRQAQRAAVRANIAAITQSPRSVVVGNPNGDTTIVEFFDYNCGFCKRGLADIRELMRTDPKLRVVLKDFPVLGPESLEASQVAVAVKNQLKGDKYFDFHIKLMESRGRVDKERAMAVARESGVDMSRLARDLESPETRATIAENIDMGDRLGLTGTPAYIIGEELVFGAVGRETLRKTVAGVRQCGKATC
jgi:protein-disulfide isomerase